MPGCVLSYKKKPEAREIVWADTAADWDNDTVMWI